MFRSPDRRHAARTSASAGVRRARSRLCARTISSAGMRSPARRDRAPGLGRAGDFRQTVWPSRLGRLRDRDQQCGFAEREPSRLLAEIGMRGRAHAFQVAAVGGEREIEREDVVLGELALELDGPHGLAQLRAERAVGARLEQARDLHGERGTARDDAPVRDELERRAATASGSTPLVVEALVLVGDQQIEVTRIDVFHGRGQPPAAVDSRVRPQQSARCGRSRRSKTRCFPERRGAEGMDPRGEGAGARHRTESQCDGSGAMRRHRRWSFAHFAASISTEPTPVRPKRSGRYMSST